MERYNAGERRSVRKPHAGRLRLAWLVGATMAAGAVPSLSQPVPGQEPSAKVSLVTTREVPLGKIPSGLLSRLPVVSPDSSRVAWVIARDGRQTVVVDGREGVGYDKVWPDSLCFGPAGNPIWYVAQRGGSSFVVQNGAEGDEYDAIMAGSFVLSPDGTRYAHVAKRGGQWFVVVNNAPGRPYPWLGDRPAFSPDGKRVAYTACRDSLWRVVVDGTEGKPYRMTSEPVFTPDGSRVTYWATREDGRKVFVVNGEETEEYNRAIEGSLRFSPDGRRVAYAVRGKKGTCVVVDGVEGKEHDSVWSNSILFSPDSKRVAYMARRQGKGVVVLDAVESKEYEWMVPDTFNFSPDSRHLAYWAQPSGQYTAKGIPQQFVVADGKEGRLYDVSPRFPVSFSPDGKHVAYWALRDGKMIVVADGTESSENYPWLWGCKLVFDGPSRFHGLAVRNNECFRFEMEIIGSPPSLPLTGFAWGFFFGHLTTRDLAGNSCCVWRAFLGVRRRATALPKKLAEHIPFSGTAGTWVKETSCAAALTSPGESSFDAHSSGVNSRNESSRSPSQCMKVRSSARVPTKSRLPLWTMPIDFGNDPIRVHLSAHGRS